MPLVFNGSGTIGGLSVGGLPDATVTAADLASGAARTNFGAGALLQVVQTATTSTASTTSGSYVDLTGLSVSITPSSTSNKILVAYAINCSNDTDTGIFVEIQRGSTSIATNWAYYGQPANFTFSGYPITCVYLDSPSTTSSTTYKLRWRADVGGQAVYLNRSENGAQTGFMSSITVMEIAG
jgi:hypothetical protein